MTNILLVTYSVNWSIWSDVYIHHLHIYTPFIYIIYIYIWSYIYGATHGLITIRSVRSVGGRGGGVYCKYHTLCCILLIYSDRDHGTCRWCPGAKWCQIGTRASATCWVGCNHNMTWAVTRLFVCVTPIKTMFKGGREVANPLVSLLLAGSLYHTVNALWWGKWNVFYEKTFFHHTPLTIYIYMCVCVSFHGAHN